MSEADIYQRAVAVIEDRIGSEPRVHPRPILAGPGGIPLRGTHDEHYAAEATVAEALAGTGFRVCELSTGSPGCSPGGPWIAFTAIDLDEERAIVSVNVTERIDEDLTSWHYYVVDMAREPGGAVHDVELVRVEN